MIVVRHYHYRSRPTIIFARSTFRALPAPSSRRTTGGLGRPLLLHGLMLGKTQANSLGHFEKSSGAVLGTGNFRLIETL